MKQREALNSIYTDILRTSIKRNKILKIALFISVVLNLILVGMIIPSKANIEHGIDDAFVISAVAVKKPSEHIATRQKLKDIADVKTFNDLLDRCILTEQERSILEQHYLHGRNFLSIAMEMGYSEDAVKHKHQKILKRIKKLL